MTNKTILDIFRQSKDQANAERWVVQYRVDYDVNSWQYFVDPYRVEHRYFDTWAEANEYAMQFGYND